jgi:hypothetical protein
MFRRPDPVPAVQTAGPTGAVRLDEPHDTCFRCGRPVPVGVSLCEHDNPARIKSPSATQVHGTIVIGVIGGFVGLMLLLRLISADAGSFAASVGGVASRAGGGIDVTVQVSNSGTGEASASCRVGIGGGATYRDYVFVTGPIAPGETLQLTKSIDAAQSGISPNMRSVVVRCN